MLGDYINIRYTHLTNKSSTYLFLLKI